VLTEVIGCGRPHGGRGKGPAAAAYFTEGGDAEIMAELHRQPALLLRHAFSSIVTRRTNSSTHGRVSSFPRTITFGRKGRGVTAVLGKGVYSFSEAARLTQLRPKRVREWFRGRSATKSRNPVFKSDFEPVAGEFAISFLDLVDVYVAGQLREHGVSLQTIRRVYDRLADELKTEHPFCRKELLSDGKVVLTRGLDAAGKEEVTEVLTKQRVFPSIILPFLQRIDYDRVSILAQRWRIAPGVVLDPALCFGTPIVEDSSFPTAILASAFYANGSNADRVAVWYNLSATQVMAAVRFEKSLAA
jgi:uncharacterized protein (DUF433 family)